MPRLTLQPKDASVVIARKFERAIRSGRLKPGDPLPPARQLAKEYKVPFNTARSVLRRLKRMRLIDGRQGSGMFVRQTGGAPGSVPWVALLVAVQGHVYGPMCEMLAGLLADEGYRTVKVGAVRQHAHDEKWVNRLIAEWQDDPPVAVVAGQGCRLLDRRIEKDFADRCRLISIRRYMPGNTLWNNVDVDIEQLAEQAVDELVSHGHRQIGFLTYRRWADQHPRKRAVGHTPYIRAIGHALRRRGLRDALRIFYSHDREVFGYHGVPQFTPVTPDNIKLLTKWLQRSDRPTAVLGDDVRVAAAMRAAEQAGLTPGRDLVGLGFGNTPWSVVFNFDSFWLHEDLFAKRITELITQSSAESETQSIVVPSVLIRRGAPNPPATDSSPGSQRHELQPA